MLEAVTNPGNGGSGSGKGEVESSSSSSIADGAKGITEAPPTSSHEKGSKKAKKDKQEKSSSGKKLVQFLFTTPCDCFSERAQQLQDENQPRLGDMRFSALDVVCLFFSSGG